LVSAEDADLTLTGDGNALTTSDVTVTISDDQDGAASFDFDSGAASLDNSVLNIAAAAGANATSEIAAVNYAGNLTLNMTDDLTIATLTPAGTVTAGAVTDDIIIAGTGDLTLTNAIAAATQIDASQLVGGVSATTAGGGTETITILGGSGDDDITLADVSNTVVFEGGAGDDTLDATTLVTGTLIAEGGAGDDAITIGTTTGTAVVDGGAGDDTITLAGAAPTGTITIEGGAGDDDNLDMAGIDTTGATLTISGIEVIEMGGSISIDAAVITGQTLTFESDTGAGTLTIDMTATANATLDTSNFTLSEAGGLVVDDIAITVAGVDTITLGANQEALAITGEAGTYTDVDGSGNFDDGDTFFGEFSLITGYDQGTVAGGAITTAEDTGHDDISGGQADEIALNGTWNAVTSTFTVDDTNGVDCIVFSDTADLCAVFLGTTDLIV